MTLNLIWSIYIVLEMKYYKEFIIGMVSCFLQFSPYLFYVQSYNQKYKMKIEQFMK
jgi:hypothetical protein